MALCLVLMACAAPQSQEVEYGEVIATSRQQPRVETPRVQTSCVDASLATETGFACRTREALQEALPNASIEGLDTMALQVRIDEGDVLEVGLERFASEFRSMAASDRERMFERFIAATAQGLRDAQSQQSPSASPERLRSILKPLAWLESFPAGVHRPWLGGLIEVLVEDLPATVRFVRAGELDPAGLDEAFARARANLADGGTLVCARPRGICALAVHDGYDAARALVPALFAQIADTHGGDFVVALPSRDHLYVARVADVAALRAQTQEVYQSAPMPLSRLLFQYRDGAWVVFPDSP